AVKGYYRMKMINLTYAVSYSSEVLLTPARLMPGINIYPNPVSDVLKIDFRIASHTYKIKLLNMVNQVLKEIDYNSSVGDKLVIQRTGNMGSGMYLIKITDLNTNEEF